MTNTLPIGHILENEYRIEKVLGAGGFGITYLAKDINLNYPVVIKEFLPQDMAGRDQSRISIVPFSNDRKTYDHLLKRFSEEAQLLAKMRHPNIVKVIRFFKANNTAYFVMEYSEGETLKEYLKHKSKMNEEEILSIMMPILEGAKYVHEQGFLHRDIAPDNIYLCKNGMPILIDFGAARDAISEESKNISSIVKEGYSSPEQYTINNKQNASSDIYALGAVFYRLITGKVPPNAPHRQTSLLNDELDTVENVIKDYEGKYTPQLLHAVKKALNLRAVDRFTSVGLFQKALTGASIVDSRNSKTSMNKVSKRGENNSKFNNEKSGNTGLILSFVIVLALLLAGMGYNYLDKNRTTQVNQISPLAKSAAYDSVANTNDELEKAKSELQKLKRKQAEFEKQRQIEEERRTQQAEIERLRKEYEEYEKLQKEKALAQTEELERLRREKLAHEKQIAIAAANTPQEQVISFNENGIDILVEYPSHVRAGHKFSVTAKMTNNNSSAIQGGLTLSFPDMISIHGRSVYNNFSRIDGYSYPQKIWNEQAKRALPTTYFMVEGWQSKLWSYGETKTFSVELTAPTSLSQLKVNLRGILWIRNKNDTRKIPFSSHIYDQQGYAVKQFTINIL